VDRLAVDEAGWPREVLQQRGGHCRDCAAAFLASPDGEPKRQPFAIAFGAVGSIAASGG